MRTLPSWVMSGALGVALVGIAAPAANAAPGLTVTGWDMSTCASEGAASPQISFESDSDAPMSIVHAYGIDDQDGYASVRVGPGPGTVTSTWAPVRAGDHVVYEQNRDPQGPRGTEYAITAPECPAGSPEPTAAVWPKVTDEEPAADLSASWGDPSCESAIGATPPVLPFEWANAGEGEGTMSIAVDDQPLGESAISPQSSGTHEVSMSEGEHTYTLLDGDVVLDETTQTAPDCSTDEPGTDEPGTDDPGTDDPGADDPGTGTDEPGDDTGTPVVTAPTPEIPKVVQTG